MTGDPLRHRFAAARSGASRASLVADVGAIGSVGDIRARIAEYHAAGADHVGLVPATAEDAGARILLRERHRFAAARSGASRASLVADVGAIGSVGDIRARIAEYHAAGADHVGLVPATAEDPGARLLLRELAP